MTRVLLALPLALLMGCQTPAKVTTDADLVAAGIVALGPVLDQAMPANAAVIDKAVADVQVADRLIDAAAAGNDPTDAATIARVVQSIAPLALQAFPAGSEYALIANAAVALLPVVLSTAQLPSAAPGKVTMDANAARRVLRGVR